MIRLNCFFKAHSESDYKEALRAAVALTEKSQNHEGCLAYDIFQSATRADVFMICETWENRDVLKAHSETPEFVENVAVINRCGEMKIESFDM